MKGNDEGNDESNDESNDEGNDESNEGNDENTWYAALINFFWFELAGARGRWRGGAQAYWSVQGREGEPYLGSVAKLAKALDDRGHTARLQNPSVVFFRKVP